MSSDLLRGSIKPFLSSLFFFFYYCWRIMRLWLLFKKKKKLGKESMQSESLFKEAEWAEKWAGFIKSLQYLVRILYRFFFFFLNTNTDQVIHTVLFRKSVLYDTAAVAVFFTCSMFRSFHLNTFSFFFCTDAPEPVSVSGLILYSNTSYNFWKKTKNKNMPIQRPSTP